jgi:hypothetical protein
MATRRSLALVSLSLFLLGFFLLAMPCTGLGAGAAAAGPFESNAVALQPTGIDAVVLNRLQAKGIEPAPLCSDEVFVRRVYLDVIGTVPEPGEVQAFLNDRSPGKRAALIDAMLTRDEFADYWALKWGDLLRVKSEFPINLWPDAAQLYHRWIRDAIHANMPYDQFARALLTASGSNFREGPSNFYRAIQGRDSSSIAAAVALTFMGERAEKWPAARRAGMEVFFSRVAYKKTAEWKEEIVQCDPAPTGALEAVFPDGTKVSIPAGQDPRVVFADWLVSPENPAFRRAIANRTWFWLMGRGIVHEPDDIRRDNPPSNPELLALLEQDLVDSKFDLRHLFRLILNSRTYQQSSIPSSNDPDAETLFACYPVRRLDAEVLIDALCSISGAKEEYSSPIPEPFAYIPAYRRTIELADGSIGSPFLELFGRPARDTGLESERNNQVSDEQRLYLLNSSKFQKEVVGGPKMRRLLSSAKGKRAAMVRSLYLAVLSRYPTKEEERIAQQYFGTEGLTGAQAGADLAWALMNSKEFLYRH